jgi:uncharacterized protein YdhG (YjbR/CyaY superfamily)
MEKYKTIDSYISMQPEPVQSKLRQLRAVIKKAAPNAGEGINYQIPTFSLAGNLVHFAAFKTHIGFYPTPSGVEAFKQELSVYKGAKGSVQFPLDKPLPLKLITAIVKFRVKENVGRSQAKASKRTRRPLPKSK